MAASPSTGLRGGQQVRVTGAHLTPGEHVDVYECRAGLTTCNGLGHRSATVTGSGSFSTSITVDAFVGFSSCGTSGCVLRVRRASGGVLAVPISFG